MRLAESLHAVISQRLIKRVDGKSRAVAAEVLVNTPAVKDMIIDGQRVSEIKDYMEAATEQYGMQSFDQALTDWYVEADLLPCGDGRGEQTVGLRAQAAHVRPDVAARVHEHDTIRGGDRKPAWRGATRRRHPDHGIGLSCTQ